MLQELGCAGSSSKTAVACSIARSAWSALPCLCRSSARHRSRTPRICMVLEVNVSTSARLVSFLASSPVSSSSVLSWRDTGSRGGGGGWGGYLAGFRQPALFSCIKRLCERVRQLHGVLRVQAPEAREPKLEFQKLQRCEIGSICKFPEALQDRNRWHYFCTLLKPSAGCHCSGVCHRLGAHCCSWTKASSRDSPQT